jgi:hypothetical protein
VFSRIGAALGAAATTSTPVYKVAGAVVDNVTTKAYLQPGATAIITRPPAPTYGLTAALLGKQHYSSTNTLLDCVFLCYCCCTSLKHVGCIRAFWY